MDVFRPVRSGLQISRDIADLLENAAPDKFGGTNRTKTIRECNDILQGRSQQPITALYQLLEETCGPDDAGAIARIKRDAEAFFHQKLLLTYRYTLTGSQTYNYEASIDNPRRPLKLIQQPLFDHAAEHGFPPDFFSNSCFDHVTIYCMPENADCSASQFRDCTFSVCGIRGAVFDKARIYDTEFHSVLFQMVNFTGASIAHSRFWDSEFTSVSFQGARLKSCLTVDCEMDRVDFQNAMLDGSSYGRIKAREIMNLSSAAITQGGATTEEVRQLRAFIFRELGGAAFPIRPHPAPDRGKKRPAPER